jgi:Ca2+-binding EF-hand superfamily protein
MLRVSFIIHNHQAMNNGVIKNLNILNLLEEFLETMKARMSDKETRKNFDKVFRLFNNDNSDSITLRNLRCVKKKLGETMTDEEL